MMCKVGKCVFLSLELYLSQLAVRLQPKGVDVNLEGIRNANFLASKLQAPFTKFFRLFQIFWCGTKLKLKDALHHRD